jgi:hypothetical protein
VKDAPKPANTTSLISGLDSQPWNRLQGNPKTYHILLHFVKKIKEYTSTEVSELTLAQFRKMNMNMEDILVPIAPLYSTKGVKPWNGMIKVHLQHLETNGHALFSGLRIFSLTLDGETKIPKVAKIHTLAPNDLFTVTISSPNLSYLPHYEILTRIVEMDFHREQDHEITQVHKQKGEAKAYTTKTGC